MTEPTERTQSPSPDPAQSPSSDPASSSAAVPADAPGTDSPAVESSEADALEADSAGTDSPEADSSGTDSGAADADAVDSEVGDSGAADADAEMDDSEAVHAEVVDSETADAEVVDPEAADSETVDAEAADAETDDSETADPEADDSEVAEEATATRVVPAPGHSFGDFAAFDASDELFADPRGDTGFPLSDDPGDDDDPTLSRDDFGSMLKEFESGIQEVREGEIVRAKVVRVTDATVILEFGFKSEGAVSKEEFRDSEALAPGYEVEVLLESLEDDDGVVVLSKKKADFLRVWEKIREAYDAGSPIEGTLVRKIKGGMTVDLMGVDAFLPGSQIALRRVPNIEDLVGKVYDFKIIKLNKRRRNIVVSRRVILEAERGKKRETLVKELLVGQVRAGVIKNITDFGAFIDLGGLDGLLHITDMSWGRVGHPSDMVDIGQELDVKVLDVDWKRERISLGLKQLLPYPWTDIDLKYPVGVRVRGKVVSITNYGAFVELEKGVEGLVHISEMSWTRNVRHPSKLVSIGDEIEAVVLKVDPAAEKISLGMKQIEEDPWLALPLKYPTGTRLQGQVRNLTSFGAFVEIEPGIDGLVHVSDMSWTKRVEHPSEIVSKGQELEVMVLDVDGENKRISLGIKQVLDDPWPWLSERFAPGVECVGSVVRVQEKGVVVDLGENVEAFVPISHSRVRDGQPLEAHYEPGDEVDLKVLESDAANRRIVVEVTAPPRRHDPEEPGDEASEAGEGSEGAADADAADEAVADAAGEADATGEASETADESDQAADADGADEAAADAAGEADATGEASETGDEGDQAADADAADEAATDVAGEADAADETAETDDESDQAADAEAADETAADAAGEADAADETAETDDESDQAADAEAADETAADAAGEDPPREPGGGTDP